MSRDPSDNNQHLPVWLRNVPLPPRPASVDAPAVQPPAPAWLADPAPAAGDDVPDWLRDVSDPAPDAPAANDLPSWLSSDAPTIAASTPRASEPPDWLRASVEQTASATSPDSAAAANDVGASGEVPDWLRQTTEEPAPEPEVPSWLREQMPVDVAPSAPTVVAAPSWSASPPPPQDVTASEAQADDDDDVPGWLRDIPMDEVRQVMSDENHETEITSTPFTFEGAESSTRAAPSSEVPSWLGTIAEGTPAETAPSWLDTLTTQPAPPATPEPEVPDWLRGMNAAPPSPLSAGPASAEPEPSPPDWLRDMAPPGATPTWRPDAAHGEPDASEPPAWEVGSSAALEPDSSEDIPSWLRDASPSTPAPVEETPSWLREASPSTPAPVEETPSWLRDASPSTPAPVEETPSWLRDASPSTPAPAETPAADDDIPAWLREASAPAPAAPAEDVPGWLRPATSAAAAPAEDVPPWLREASPAEAPAAPTPTEDVPPWLREASSADVPAQAVPSGADLPDWLRATQPPEEAPSPPSIQPVELPLQPVELPPAEDLPPWLRDEAGTPLPTAAESNLPIWLRGVPTDEPPTSATPTANDLPRDRTPISDPTPAPPAWLGAEASAPVQRAEPAPAESEFLGGADLPAWLRPQETEKPAPIDAESVRSLNWLTRISPAEDETVAPEETPQSSKLALPQAPIRTLAHHQALALLERLASEPFPEHAALPTLAPTSMWQRVGMDRALYLLLLLALVLALAVPSLVASLEAPPSVPTTTAALYQKFDALTNQDVVLVGYEWDARRVSELRPLQDAVIGHLISKGVKLVLVSTDPQGTLLSYDLRYTLAASGYTPGGSDYIILGYKPGGELALRQLAQNLPSVLASDFQGNDANIGGLANGIGTQRPLRSLRDFSAILVLADDPVDVQGWMEQVHRSAPSVPIAFMLPEETAPVTQPYMRQPNVLSLAGKAGALSYESLRGDLGSRGPALLQEAGQQRLGLLVFVVLFIIGALGVGVTNTLERRRRGL